MLRKRLLIIGAIVVTEAFAFAIPAWAAGQFSWTCQFTFRCVSRTWETPNTGTHTIKKTNADCPGVGNVIQIRIVRERFGPDEFYAWKTYACGTGDLSRSWAISDDAGNFHFDLEKNDTNDEYWAWTVYGVTYYP